MFGERYFATRERLLAVVKAVRELAEDTGSTSGPLKREEVLRKGLEKPFVFLACGEINAGKSTFLNGLVGKVLCESAVVPVTKEVIWYRYGDRAEDKVVAEGHLEAFRQEEFLREFTIVDTPGLNGIQPACLEALEAFLEVAEVVFFIFPVTNPWSATMWNFLSQQPPSVRERMAVILQQKDLRGEEDMRVMLGHIRELSSQKLGEIPEIFPVSGLQALEAKSAGNLENSLWRVSGFPALEKFISRQVSSSPLRLAKMREIRDQTAAVLRGIEDRMEIRRGTLDSDQGFLRDIENEVERERAQQAQRLAEKFSGLGEVFEAEAEKAGILLAERTTMWRSLGSLFRRDGTPAEIEKGLVEAVQKAIEELASADSEELVGVCWGHWQTVIPRVEERLEMPPPDFEKESQGFAQSKERFAKRLGGAARKAVMAQKIRGMLESEMAERQSSLRQFVMVSLGLVIVAGALGACQLHGVAWVLLLAAAGVLAFGLHRARQRSLALQSWFEERTAACCRPFAEHLAADYQEGVRGFFVEYATMFEGIRRHVAVLKMKLKPQLECWNDCFLELNAIDQDL